MIIMTTSDSEYFVFSFCTVQPINLSPTSYVTLISKLIMSTLRLLAMPMMLLQLILLTYMTFMLDRDPPCPLDSGYETALEPVGTECARSCMPITEMCEADSDIPWARHQCLPTPRTERQIPIVPFSFLDLLPWWIVWIVTKCVQITLLLCWCLLHFCDDFRSVVC